MFSQKDTARLRALAHFQMDYAMEEENLRRVREWKRHNAAIPGRPIIHVEIDNIEKELFWPLLECTDPQARELEKDLFRNFYNYKYLNDDWVVPPYFGVTWKPWFHIFDFPDYTTNATDLEGNKSVGYQFHQFIEDLEESWDQFQPSTWGIDREPTLRYLTLAQDTFGDILPARIIGRSVNTSATQSVVHFMSMENMCINMFDYPELFSTMMDRLADDYMAYHHFLESEGLLCPTTAFEHLCQGSKCFTDELPNTEHPRLRDVWGYMDSQESASISPAMFHDLIFPTYRKISGQFGLFSYGCCEAVSSFWEDIRTLPNLRKVSISPWCDEEYMGPQLAGSKVIYLRKPSPNFLAVDPVLNEEAVRAHFRKTIHAAQGCTLEFAQRDLYTVHNDPPRLRRYVEILRQECENHRF